MMKIHMAKEILKKTENMRIRKKFRWKKKPELDLQTTSSHFLYLFT